MFSGGGFLLGWAFDLVTLPEIVRGVNQPPSSGSKESPTEQGGCSRCGSPDIMHVERTEYSLAGFFSVGSHTVALCASCLAADRRAGEQLKAGCAIVVAAGLALPICVMLGSAVLGLVGIAVGIATWVVGVACYLVNRYRR